MLTLIRNKAFFVRDSELFLIDRLRAARTALDKTTSKPGEIYSLEEVDSRSRGLKGEGTMRTIDSRERGENKGKGTGRGRGEREKNPIFGQFHP